MKKEIVVKRRTIKVVPMKKLIPYEVVKSAFRLDKLKMTAMPKKTPAANKIIPAITLTIFIL